MLKWHSFFFQTFQLPVYFLTHSPSIKSATLARDAGIRTRLISLYIMEQFPVEKQENNPAVLGHNQQQPALTVDQLDIEILPVIYDIIRCVEKNPVDNAAKQRESQECSQKILELQKRFDSARNQIKQLPGIDYNKEEQLQKLDQLKNQLMLKQKLIKKYKNKQF